MWDQGLSYQKATICEGIIGILGPNLKLGHVRYTPKEGPDTTIAFAVMSHYDACCALSTVEKKSLGFDRNQRQSPGHGQV